MAPRHHHLLGELWNGSRALGRALGRVRRGATAVGMAMKVDAMVGANILVKLIMSIITILLIVTAVTTIAQ